MKKFGPFIVVLMLAVSPAMAVTEIIGDQTYQCWDFSQPTSPIGIIGSGNNAYGTPSANINDLSVTSDLDRCADYGCCGSNLYRYCLCSGTGDTGAAGVGGGLCIPKKACQILKYN